MFKTESLNTISNSSEISNAKNKLIDMMEAINISRSNIIINSNQEALYSVNIVEKYSSFNEKIQSNLNTLEITEQSNHSNYNPITINSKYIDNDTYFTNYINNCAELVDVLEKLNEIILSIEDENESKALEALVEIFKYLNHSEVVTSLEELSSYNSDLGEYYADIKEILGLDFKCSLGFLNNVINNSSALNSNITEFNNNINSYELILRKYKDDELIGYKYINKYNKGVEFIPYDEKIVKLNTTSLNSSGYLNSHTIVKYVEPVFIVGSSLGKDILTPGSRYGKDNYSVFQSEYTSGDKSSGELFISYEDHYEMTGEALNVKPGDKGYKEDIVDDSFMSNHKTGQTSQSESDMSVLWKRNLK